MPARTNEARRRASENVGAWAIVAPYAPVLLWASWRKGRELFAFDNHDPRGGCVLLNDGTVKFIRTEEELHALRWR